MNLVCRALYWIALILLSVTAFEFEEGFVMKPEKCYKICKEGGCYFKDCQEAKCPGGACHFVNCNRPSCSGIIAITNICFSLKH